MTLPLTLFLPMSEVRRAMLRYVAITYPEMERRQHLCEWTSVPGGIEIRELMETEETQP